MSIALTTSLPQNPHPYQIVALNYVSLYFQTLQEAVAFYQQVFGPPQSVNNHQQIYGWRLGSTWLTLLPSRAGTAPGSNPCNTEFAVQVATPEEVDQLYQALLAAGAKTCMAPADTRMYEPMRFACVDDPFGVRIDVYCPLGSLTAVSPLLNPKPEANQAAASWEAMYQDEKYSWFWPPAYDPKSPPAELESVISLLDAQPQSRLLDLACGQGWLTIALAQRGFQVTGFDLSAILLKRAQQVAEQAGVGVEWVRGDMRSLPKAWTDYFHSVSFTLSEFGCFSNEAENQQVLDEVARVLKPGGRFLLDIVVNRDGLICQRASRDCLEGDGFFVSQQDSLDLLTGIHERLFHWYYQGQRHEIKWRIRAYTPPEVACMLAKAGLRILAVYGNLKGETLTRESTGMTFVAQKEE